MLEKGTKNVAVQRRTRTPRVEIHANGPGPHF